MAKDEEGETPVWAEPLVLPGIVEMVLMGDAWDVEEGTDPLGPFREELALLSVSDDDGSSQVKWEDWNDVIAMEEPPSLPGVGEGACTALEDFLRRDREQDEALRRDLEELEEMSRAVVVPPQPEAYVLAPHDRAPLTIADFLSPGETPEDIPPDMLERLESAFEEQARQREEDRVLREAADTRLNALRHQAVSAILEAEKRAAEMDEREGDMMRCCERADVETLEESERISLCLEEGRERNALSAQMASWVLSVERSAVMAASLVRVGMVMGETVRVGVSVPGKSTSTEEDVCVDEAVAHVEKWAFLVAGEEIARERVEDEEWQCRVGLHICPGELSGRRGIALEEGVCWSLLTVAGGELLGRSAVLCSESGSRMSLVTSAVCSREGVGRVCLAGDEAGELVGVLLWSVVSCEGAMRTMLCREEANSSVTLRAGCSRDWASVHALSASLAAVAAADAACSAIPPPPPAPGCPVQLMRSLRGRFSEVRGPIDAIRCVLIWRRTRQLMREWARCAGPAGVVARQCRWWLVKQRMRELRRGLGLEKLPEIDFCPAAYPAVAAPLEQLAEAARRREMDSAWFADSVVAHGQRDVAGGLEGRGTSWAEPASGVPDARGALPALPRPLERRTESRDSGFNRVEELWLQGAHGRSGARTGRGSRGRRRPAAVGAVGMDGLTRAQHDARAAAADLWGGLEMPPVPGRGGARSHRPQSQPETDVKLPRPGPVR